MPWKEASTMSLRLEFVSLALSNSANISRLCLRFGISRKTGYKWIERFQLEGAAGLLDRSRCPHRSPRRTPDQVEDAILAVRDAHPAWGGRKIKARLEALGVAYVPAPSTITEILRRNNRLDPEEAQKHQSWQRFEAETPNQLWQMDFKGHFPLARGGRCHPLTVLDDHSRFALGLRACGNERRITVQNDLTAIFHRYGLPERILVDNGSPWGYTWEYRHTGLSAWLIRLGVTVIYARPRHPQTLGKGERFHRTLEAELLRGRTFKDLKHCQQLFDPWRDMYNLERPHQALDMAVPVSRYRESPRTFPETLPPIEYGPDDIVRKVDETGRVFYRYKKFKVGKGFRGYYVALRPTLIDGVFDVFFCHQKVKSLDLRVETHEP